MNLLNNSLSLRNDLSIRFPESFSVSCSAICKSSFVKFNELFRNGFFISEIWNNFFQERKKSFGSKSPSYLIFKSFRSFDKVTKASEATLNPIKHRTFSVIQLKYSFIDKIRCIFGLIFTDSKVTFSVNKTSHIDEVFSCRSYLINLFKFFNIFNRDEIKFFMSNLHLFNKLKLFFFTSFVEIRKKQKTFIFSLNKMRKQFFAKFFSGSSFFSKRVNRFLFRVFYDIRIQSSTISGNEMINYIKVSRRNNKRSCNSLFATGDRKTTVSVGIASKVNNVFKFIHNLYSKVFKSLKQQHWGQDNPTEMTIADVENINEILQGNDGEYVEKFMMGDDKFGTAPIRDSYLCLSHTDMTRQWANVAGFINKAQYPNPNGTVNLAELGSSANLRIFTSSRGSITANASALGADVYNNFVVAQEGYSCTELEGGKVQLTYQAPGQGDDICHLRSKMGFRFTFGTSIDQDLWVQNLRATLA